MRPSGRQLDQMRDVILEIDVARHAEGSCFAKFGDTHVLCTASVEQRVPPWMRDSGKRLGDSGIRHATPVPRIRDQTAKRRAANSPAEPRKIQRLIGRSLRAVTNLEGMGELQIKLDCDVIQADGGTRTASITGAYVALYRAFSDLSETRHSQGYSADRQRRRRFVRHLRRQAGARY